MSDSRIPFVVVLVGLTALHVVLAAALPLSGDEAYYWDCSRHPDWSYFDQPPLVIWAMVPFRAVLGETRLAVRAPAVLASLLIGAFLLPLARRLGGGPRHAAGAYLLLHATPIFFLGSFYTSTDVAMASAYLAAVWAAAAVAQAEPRGWWGAGLAIGIGFLAKFPAVLAAASLLPAVARGPAWRDLRRPTPWLAGTMCLLVTAPVWLWAAGHGGANLTFQLAGRHQRGPLTAEYLAEYVVGNLLLATPFLAVAAVLAWRLAAVHHDPAWLTVRFAAAVPLVFFGAVALLTMVSPHWAAPGLPLALLLLVLVGFRGRRTLVVLGAVSGLALSLAALAVVWWPEPLLDVSWSWGGRAHRLSTDKVAALIGNREITEAVLRARRPHELVTSESYSTVHLLAFMSAGELETRLANVAGGKHGLASLYWYRPEELRGRDYLFVTERDDVDARLRELFAEVRDERPIQVVRSGRVVRTVRLLRCRDLLRPQEAFTRLAPRITAPASRAGGGS